MTGRSGALACGSMTWFSHTRGRKRERILCCSPSGCQGKGGQRWAGCLDLLISSVRTSHSQYEYTNKNSPEGLYLRCLAETKGFEPLMQVLPACSLSRGVPSTSRPRLQPFKRRDNTWFRGFWSNRFYGFCEFFGIHGICTAVYVAWAALCLIHGGCFWGCFWRCLQ